MSPSIRGTPWRSKTPRIAAELVSLVCAITMGLMAISSKAQPAAVAEAAARCKSLESADFSRTLDAPTQIVGTTWLGTVGETKEVCQVNGYVAPSVHFVMRLPAQNWNGKFLEQGCGGFCGSTGAIVACDDPLHRGYACIVSDMGHESTDTQALWAYHNWQTQIDHAYRSAHVTALAGKALVEHYYHQPPRKSYFTGCSTGGRQAMMEAQRFPWDFDGILAASPSLYITPHHMSLLWANRALTDAAGKSLLSQKDLDLLHSAALEKCDLDDGVRDGVIGNPLACKFDPETLLCAAGKDTGCLTATQVEAVKKVYSGPTTSAGEPIFPEGRALVGSERVWLDYFVNWLFSGEPDGARHFVAEQFRYIAFDPAPGPDWKPEFFDFDRDYKRLGEAQGLFDADNPDLRRFKATGGKLIAYTGLNDAVGLALPPVDYYETTERTMGGREATQEFFRLFALPGVEHCAGGDGADVVDWLSHLEAWVEKGQPPDKLIATHLDADRKIKFTRPVYPYPVRAKYQGYGDPNDASSFGSVGPSNVGKRNK